MGYSQALSGLGAASAQLDTVGNNIANSSTFGFKSGTAQFADMYANTLMYATNNGAGIGVRTVGVEQNFGQGTFAQGGMYSAAINGNGFFRLSDHGTTVYSRNGDFHRDPNGYIVNAEGQNLTGYPTGPNGVVSTTSPQPLRIPDGAIPPKASTKVTATSLNLDSSEGVPKISPFDPMDTSSYNHTSQYVVYDSLGDPHTVTMFFVRNPQPTPPVSPPTVAYSVYADEDGSLITPTAPVTTAGLVGTMTYDTNGNLTSFADANGAVAANPFQVNVTLSSTTGSNTPIPFMLDFAGATAYGGVGDSANLQPDGYPSSTFTGISITADGLVQGTYSHGETMTLGQIVLASFNNPNGLRPIGNNAWAETADSGTPAIGVPTTGALGELEPGRLENSNVDLTASLVDLITAQRFYQANAQTIKTQQTVDQSILQL